MAFNCSLFSAHLIPSLLRSYSWRLSIIQVDWVTGNLKKNSSFISIHKYFIYSTTLYSIRIYLQWNCWGIVQEVRELGPPPPSAKQTKRPTIQESNQIRKSDSHLKFERKTYLVFWKSLRSLLNPLTGWMVRWCDEKFLWKLLKSFFLLFFCLSLIWERKVK